MNDDQQDQVIQLLHAARDGDSEALSKLFTLLYQDLRHLARARLRRNQPLTQLDTTALVHESYVRLVKTDRFDLPSKHHFFAYAARAMRSVIIDFIRHKQTERRGGQHTHIPLSTDLSDSLPANEDDVIRISEALDELSTVDARAVQVVEMRYFAGMTEPEIAEALGITERTVRRDWQKARLLLQATLS